MKFSDVLSHFSEVTEQPDGGYLALCPAHNDSRPSLRIWRGDDEKVRVTCRSGCKPDDIVTASGLTWSAMFNATGEGLTVSAEKPVMVGPGPLAELAQYIDDTTLRIVVPGSEWAAIAGRYLADRFGLDVETAVDLGIGLDDVLGAPLIPHLSRAYRAFARLTVPLYGFDGVARGLQGRDLTGECPGRWLSLMNPKGARWAPYGVFRGQGGYGVVLVTEGPGDALTAVSVGYDAVAVRGASLAGNPELIAELAAGLKGAQVVVAGDNDTAGQSFSQVLADGLAAHGIDVFTLDVPNAGDDLTDWRGRGVAGFPAALHSAIKAAKRIRGSIMDAETGALVPDDGEARRAVRIMEDFLSRYGSSDVLNAHALVAFTGGNIKYAAGLGFFVWDGTVWQRSETRVRQAIHYMGAALTVAAAEETDDARRKELQRVSKGFTSRRRIDDLMCELRAVPSVHVEPGAFDARPDLISFKNGTVDLRTGRLRPHDSRDMLTYALDIDYRSDATCPRWLRFLDEIFPGQPELPPYMRRLTGYGITGNVSEQCFAVLWGKGSNGKSVLTDTLTAVFRNVTKTTPFATFEEKTNGGIPNDVAALRGSRLVMAAEGESGKPMSEAVLKRVTGKDMIAARFLRQEFFEFKPTFLLMLATNHKPKFRGQDEGLWRRVKMIPFVRYFAPHERDYGLDAALLAESEGIAAWAVQGAIEWFANGLQDPPIITNATREYRETSDALAGFFPGVLVMDDSAITPGADAFTAYLDWCEAENLPLKERWTRRAFYGAMEERGITRKKTAKGIALVGARLADAGPRATGPGIFGGE